MYKSLADAIRDAEAGGLHARGAGAQAESEDQGRTVEDIARRSAAPWL
jgi:hypothetical protein